MATINEILAANLAAANTNQAEAAYQLANRGLDGDFIATVVPVSYTVVFAVNPATSLTEEELDDMAALYGFEIYSNPLA